MGKLTKSLKANWYLYLFLAVLLGYSALALYHISLYCFQPDQMDYGEGWFYYISKAWASGTFNWNINTQPYMSLEYGPIFPMIYGFLINLFGPSLVLGRIICLLSVLVITIFMFLIAFHLTKRRILSIIVALLPFSLPFYRDWILNLRADVVAIMFAIIGLYLFLKLKGRWQYISILLFLLAIFTKQIDITIPIAVCLYLLFQKRFRQFGLFTGLIIGGVIFGILLGNLFTHGQFFNQFITYNMSSPPFNNRSTWMLNLESVFTPLVFLLVVIIFLLLKYRQFNLFVLWFIIALYFDGFLLFRKGGFVNYGLELVIATSLLFGLLFKYLETRKIMMIALIVLQFGIMSLLHYNISPYPDLAYYNRVEQATAIITDAKTPILSENIGLVVNAGKIPYYEPFFFTNLQNLGLWNRKTVINDLSDGRIEYVISEGNMRNVQPDNTSWSPAVVKTILTHYQLIYDSLDSQNDPWDNRPWYCIYVYRYEG